MFSILALEAMCIFYQQERNLKKWTNNKYMWVMLTLKVNLFFKT